MADEIIDEVPTEGTTEGTPTEDTTTGNGYLTKPYLVRNLQTFWDKIKAYITDKIKDFATEGYVAGAVSGKADKTDLASKIDQTALDNALLGKVDKVEGQGLSDNNFTDVLKTKLEELKDSVVTQSDPGLMSVDDKQKLDRINLDTLVTEVEETLSATSENPVQSKVIKNELDKKVDKETLDPSEFFNKDLMLIESATGDIVLQPRKSIKHIKLHTEKGEIIEKFYISGTNNSGETEVFNTLEGSDLEIRIPNPDGTEKPSNAVYKFYVECLEFSDSGKYKPFILKVIRDSTNPINLTLKVFKS